MRVAAVQLRSGRDFGANIETACALISQAAHAGARYVQTPEMTTLIERDRQAMTGEITPAKVDEAVGQFSRLAQELDVVLHIGSMAVPLPDGRFANRAHVFDRAGTLVTTYDKVHMFDVDLDGGETWRESAIYAPGDRAVVADLGDLRVGLGICYDVRFAALARALAQEGATMLSYPAAFTRQTGQAHWHVLLRARAIETGSFVIAAAHGGLHDDGRETYGHSLVIDPWGAIIAEKQDDEPGVLIADLALSRVDDARQKIPALRHDQPFDVHTVSSHQARAVA